MLIKEITYQMLTKHNIFINDAGNKPNAGGCWMRIASRNDAGKERHMAGLRALARTHG